LNLRVQFRVVPVRVLHRRLEVVNDEHLGHAAEMPEGVLQRTDEVLRGLVIGGFAIALAAEAQHDAKDVRPPPFAAGQVDPCPRAEIDLCLLARLALHAAKRKRARLAQLGHKPPHAVVLVVEPFAHQILVDPLGRKTQLQLLEDHLPIRLAGTATAPFLQGIRRRGSLNADHRAGGHLDRDESARNRLRADGRFGRF